MSVNWIEVEKKNYMFTVRRQPIVIARGDGTRVWDIDGKEYLDFTAGWAVNNLGHCHPAITEEITNQAKTLVQTSNQFYTLPQLRLAEILVESSVLDKVFFGNSGAEALEGVCKLAKKYGKINRDGAYEIITAFNSFHGRTQAMVAATGQPHYQESFKPLLPGFVHVPYNDVDAIIDATSDKTAAVLLEPVQGEGGVNVPHGTYLSRVKEWCEKQGILFILDEVQTGMGRLGELFGYQIFDVEPDAMALGKALGGGAPIGAFMSKDECMVLEPGDHGSTFGGNVLSCAAAFGSTRYIIDNNIPARAKEMGAILMEGLNNLRSKFNFISDIRGMGLLIAVEFDNEISADILSKSNKEGLLLNAVKPNAIRIMPPLTISSSEINQGVECLESVFRTV